MDVGLYLQSPVLKVTSNLKLSRGMKNCCKVGNAQAIAFVAGVHIGYGDRFPSGGP